MRAVFESDLEERIRRVFPAWRDLGLAAGNPLTTTFPTTPLRTRAMIALNPDYTQDYTTWNWVDITRDLETGSSIVRWEQQVSIISGGRPNSPLVDASTCKFRATNDKRFSRRNPLGPYYGQLSEYTPLWLQLDYGQGWKDRYFGFIHDFGKAWNTRADPYIDLTARGPFHRIGKSKPLKSPIFRAISGIAADDFKPQGFWPGEDASGATQIASALPNQPAVSYTGPATFGQAGPEGALSVIQVGEGFTAAFPVATYTNTNRWAVTWIMKIDAALAVGTTTLLTVHTVGSTLTTWRLIIDTTFGDPLFRWNGYDASDVLQYDVFFNPTNDPDALYGQWFMLTFGSYDPSAFPGNIQSTVAVDNGRDERFHATNGSLFAGTTGSITDFTFTVDSMLSDAGISLGEFGVFVDPNFRPFNEEAAQANGDALHGYELEPAITRLRRICREERIPFFSLAVVEESALCGPQAAGSLLNALRLPEAADAGVLYEYKFGLAYKSPLEYQNQLVSFTLDATLGEIKEIGSPVDNDLDFVNQWTVSRTGGSSVTIQGRKGEAGVTLGDNELVYEAPKTVPLALDSQLLDYAGRLVAASTVDEDRWPTLGFKLAATPALIDSWINFPFGGRINALNVYEEVGVTTLDQIHRGHSESWNSLKWDVILNCSPNAPFITAEIDSDDFGRVDSESSALALDIADDDTEFLVDTTNDSELWITTATEPDDFPVDIKLYSGTGEAISSGGETMTIAGISSPVSDTFDDSSSSGWGTTTTGQAWVIGQGTAANFSETAGVGRMAQTALNSEHFITVELGYAAHQKIRVYNTLGVTPTGAPINWGGILRYLNVNNLWWIDVQVSTAGVLTLRAISKKNGTNVQEATAVSGTAHSTSVRRILVAEVTADNVIKAKVYAEGAIEPGWELIWNDTSGDLLTGTGVGCISRLMTGNTNVTPVNIDFDNFEVLNPQQFNVDARATNGIVKAHKAGTIVRTDPMTLVG